MSRCAANLAFRIALCSALVAGSGNLYAGENQPPDAQSSATRERITQLIRQLGDPDYFVRQRAQDELARYGFEAFEALSAATQDEDLEIAARARYLLRLIRVEWTAGTDPEEVKQCLQNYEAQNFAGRVSRMQALAALPDAQGLTALCRLVRFEKTTQLSKMAAVSWLQSPQGLSPPTASAVRIIRENLQGCPRTAAGWLLCWARLGESAEAALAELDKAIEAETALLNRTPQESSAEIASALVRFQVDWLRQLGDQTTALEKARRLVALERGESLAELLAWLSARQAWQAIDELHQRFAPRIAADPALLYLLAEAYEQQGRRELAENAAGKALALNPGKQEEQLLRHLQVAGLLRDRGRIAWAKREFEYIITQVAPAENELSAMARTFAAEMLHDHEQDLEAAQMLEKLVEALDAGKVNEQQLLGRSAKEVRSRLYYFHACHWKSQGDEARHREYLEKALAADDEDIDVLIACYHLPHQTEEYRAKIKGLIQKAVADLRQEIAAAPDDSTPYNQLAWLVGNTEGDLDEALTCSQKSLELQPNTAGYYDTLAHVYFARGELENAVKYQTKAVELEPHSGLIRRQLDFFRKKLAEKQSTP